MSTLIEQAHSKQWFYAYDLPDGSSTSTYHEDHIHEIHTTRLRMLESCLDRNLGTDKSALTALDLASHQGWFAYNMARMGFASVLGIDARQSHVEDSTLISNIYGMEQLQFRRGNIHDQTTEELGAFDVVLMFGLLYHLENPVGALRVCRALCRNLCVIETQVVPGMTGYVDYGSYQYVRPLKGSFGIIDEVDDTHGPEASVTGICLVPSLEALMWLLKKVGFSEATILDPPKNAYEQLRHHKRVMVAARV